MPAVLHLVGAMFVLALTLLGSGPGRAQPAPPTPWIDVHMHLLSAARGGDFAAAVQAALAEMDRFGIARALILPPPQVDGRRAGDHVAFATALRPHRARFAWLGGGGELNAILHRHADPASVSDAVERDFVARAESIAAAGAVGFGEIAAMHLSLVAGHPFELVPADHRLLLALARVAARLDLPIDLHLDAPEAEGPTPTRFAVPPNPPRLPDTLPAFERLLAHERGARIVWAHGGSDQLGGMSVRTMERLLDAHPNLFVSIRIAPPQAPMLNKAFAADGGLDPGWQALLARHRNRFMIGTDSFFAGAAPRGGGGAGFAFAERNGPKLAATVRFLGLLAPELRSAIAAQNAMRVYRLDRR